MARILIGATGSVAAIRIPALHRALSDRGHDVRVVATEPSLHFFDAASAQPLYRDRDEWPDRPYRRDDEVPHIAFRKWADAFVVAPLDANTLAKFAHGMADNFLTCVFRAWDFAKPVVFAPAMNTLMWDSPVTLRHFRTLLEDRGDGRRSAQWGLDELAEVFELHAPAIAIVPPRAKRLACGDEGMGGMAEVEAIVAELERALADAIARSRAAVEIGGGAADAL